MKTLHCISGLPRSGSTLLSSILNQNPKFFATISDPLASLVNGITKEFEYSGWQQNILTESKKVEILQNIVQTYYKDINAEVCFNTNRIWTSKLSLLEMIYPETKVICCVRDIPSILNSFEKLRNNNILNPTSYLYGHHQSIYNRAENLMHRENIIGESLNNLKEGFYSINSNKIIIVEYDSLILKPKETIRKLYSALNLEYFDHDYTNLSQVGSLNDPNMPKNLHHVSTQIIEEKAKPCLPPDLWHKFSGMEFWRN